jgi:hypothetical protein
MRKLMYLFIATAILSLTGCEKEQIDQPESSGKLKSTQIGINNSSIYKVETAALWTTSLNGLTILIKYNVSASTKIYLNYVPAKLSQLKPGFRVTVYYDNSTGETIKISAFGS